MAFQIIKVFAGSEQCSKVLRTVTVFKSTKVMLHLCEEHSKVQRSGCTSIDTVFRSSKVWLGTVFKSTKVMNVGEQKCEGHSQLGLVSCISSSDWMEVHL